MSKTYKILFIDDDFDEVSTNEVSRKHVLQALASSGELEIKALHPKEFIKLENKGSFLRNNFSIAIIDYELNHKKFDGEKFDGTGRSVAAMIREKAPLLPLYLVSRNIEDNYSCSDVFEKVLTHSILTEKEGREMLVSNARDFKEIKSRRKNESGLISVFKLLKVPKESKESLKLALPNEFHKSLFNVENDDLKKIGFERPIKFARWVLGKLIENPGPLCSDQEAAQILGLTEQYFTKTFVKTHKNIDKCRYSGIFSSNTKSRWWRDSLFIWVGDNLKTKGYSGELPWKVLPELLRISSKNHSKCIICGQKKPDCLAYDEQISKKDKRYMAHWECSKVAEDIHPDFGFNEFFYLVENG